MDIGLECYISEHSGFCGQLKKLYPLYTKMFRKIQNCNLVFLDLKQLLFQSCEDFVVTEVDESGCLVELTSQEIQPNIDKDVDKCHSSNKVTAETAKNDDALQHDNRLVTSGSCSNAEKKANTDKDSSLPPTNKYFYKVAEYNIQSTLGFDQT